jgi:hypothetical protein
VLPRTFTRQPARQLTARLLIELRPAAGDDAPPSPLKVMSGHDPPMPGRDGHYRLINVPSVRPSQVDFEITARVERSPIS